MKIFPVLLGGLVLLAGCASRAPANLRVSGDRLFVEASVNGFPVEALLDSGAELSLVDIELADAAGLPLGERAEARGTGAAPVDVHFIENVDLSAVGLDMPDRTIIALDLTDIAERVVGEPLSMVMGRDLFDAGRLYLDIDAAVLRPARTGETPQGTALPLSDANGIKQVPIEIDGHPVLADFDLGNGSGILISRAFAERAGLLAPDRQAGTRRGGGLGGAVELDLASIDTLEIAGKTFCGLTVAISAAEDGAEANIGMSVLRHFTMVIDFPADQVWLAPVAGHTDNCSAASQ